jgi:ribosomal protein L13
MLTGKKVFYKEVVYHSGFIGGLKRIPYRKLLALFPERLVQIIY